MKILAVEDGSPAARAGLRAGDRLLAADGCELRDTLDYLFYTAEEEVYFTVARSDCAECEICVTRAPGEELGLRIPEDPIRRCGNKCVFCFIDQNPPGLRRSLYVKDEDYRLSLLYGNYVTLTNLEEWEIERIIAQHLSPLYVSVHATDPAVRALLLRCRGDHEILPIVRRLAAGGIEMHTQVVLVPGYNDGAILEQTLRDLEPLHPNIATVAIVPLGLTAHRQKLPALTPVSAEMARGVLALISARGRAALSRWGHRIHFAADEFYLTAKKPFPPGETYEGFPQVENGVGLVRSFEADLAAREHLFAPGSDIASGRESAILATGKLFAPLLKERLEGALVRTGERDGFDVRVLGVQNQLFGPMVTVAGLLGGAELAAALTAAGDFDRAVISPEMFNTEGQTLDGWSLPDLADRIGRPIQIGFGGELCRPR